MSAHHAVLLLSFGGPEAPEEVLPFLRRVTAGRGIPDERLAAVGEHYDLFGGRSPINDANRALLADLRAELDRRGDNTPLLWGNRNSAPFLADTLREAEDAGVRSLRTVITSAWSSYSSCRQYREDLAAAQAEAGTSLDITRVRKFGAHRGFVDANADLLGAAVRPLLAADRTPHVVCVTHSVPTTMDETSGPPENGGQAYSRGQARLVQQLIERLNAETGAELAGDLAYCSRSGPPSQPWLEPDVNDRLEELAAAGTDTVVLVPIGFVSDHMEVVYDLDVEARATCDRLGLTMTRVRTAGTHPLFVAGLVDLLREPATLCAAGCCPNLREPRPALCGSD